MKTIDIYSLKESISLLLLLNDGISDVHTGKTRDSDAVFSDLQRMIAAKRESQNKKQLTPYFLTPYGS